MLSANLWRLERPTKTNVFEQEEELGWTGQKKQLLQSAAYRQTGNISTKQEHSYFLLLCKRVQFPCDSKNEMRLHDHTSNTSDGRSHVTRHARGASPRPGAAAAGLRIQ